MQFRFSDKIQKVKPSAIREILKATSDPNVISFAAGNPAPEAFPVEAIRQITGEVLERDPISVLQYSLTEGYPPLRRTMADLLLREYGIGRDFDELLITSGAQQAADLLSHCLLNEGDVVVTEDPSFVGCLNTFRSYGARLAGVPMEPDGIDLVRLEQVLKTEKNVKFLYLIPNFQNPTGITMSLKKRKKVYELACRYDVLILEDNPYGDLRFEGEPIPPIKSLDEEGRVVYVGSFSKVISPGIRVGYAVAHRDLIPRLTVAKQCQDVHTAILSQYICERFVSRYDLMAHVAGLREIYRKKCSLMLSEMDRTFAPSVTYTRPQGGLFLYCTLPGGMDSAPFCAEASRRGVAVVPGTAFSAQEGQPSSCFRLNYSTPTDENIVRGIRILGAMTREL